MERTAPSPGRSHRNSRASAPARVLDRSVRSVNLSRLSQQLDVDLLAAALLMRETSLRSFVQGREPVSHEYAHQIIMHLTEAGFPPGWLDMANAPITPEHIAALREMAALSVEKAPVRRDNLRGLVKAFQGRLNLLADALEITEASLSSIIEGAVRFDDQRMSHVNPRLMAAGFPNGWLERPCAATQPAWLDALESMATDTYEKAFEADRTKDAEAKLARLAAQAEVALIEKTKEELTVNAIEKTKEELTVKAKPAKPTPQSPRTSRASAPALPGKAKLPPGVSRAALAVARPAARPAAQPVHAVAVAQSVVPAAEDMSPKAVSLRRAAVLDELFNHTARRGVKAALWRDLLGKNLAYWGNVKKGAILIRDDMADKVTTAMGLPMGWLDTPSFPPQTIAAWVTDPALPLPGKEVLPSAKPTPIPSAPAVSTAKPSVAHRPAIQRPAPVVAASPTPPEIRPKAAAAPATAAPALPSVPLTGAEGFSWQPCPRPEHQAAPGPLTQVLVDQLNKMAVAGTFTEHDALRLLYYMMLPR